jgi:hypothetical protein
MAKRPYNTHVKSVAGINEEKLNAALSLPAHEQNNGEKQLVLVHLTYLRSWYGVCAASALAVCVRREASRVLRTPRGSSRSLIVGNVCR